MSRMCMCVCMCVSNFNLGKTFSEASAMLTQAFGNESMSQTQTHDCTNGLKRWRWPVFWTTFPIKRLPTCQKSLWSHPFKLTFDSARSGQWSWHFKNVPQDFDWKFGYAACCSQICATSAEWWANTEVSRSQSRPFWPCKQWQKLFKNITSGDDTWVFSYGVKTKAHSPQRV